MAIIRSVLRQLVMKAVALPRMKRIHSLEDELAQRPGSHGAADTSPERFEIVYESLTLGGNQVPLPGFPRSLPYVLSSVRNIRRSLTSLSDNPTQPRTRVEEGYLEELKDYARTIGIDSIGFATVPRKYVFRGKAVLHDKAIVLAMEMDREKMARAPSPETAIMVHETYDRLGRAANQLAERLRDDGYSAHAGHPLMGLALYPPLAQEAGIGWVGANGLLITPDYGPRVRLAAVFTNIENLPVARENDHEWVSDFCNHCNICRRECPANAIRQEAELHEDGRITCIDRDKCFPYFVTNHGCSICIKVCPFNNYDYHTLKDRVRLHERGYRERDDQS